MFKALKRFFTDDEDSLDLGAASESPLVTDQNGSIVIDNVPRYPPFVEGLPLYPPEAIMGTQQELIDRIRGILGLTPKEYEELILPLIRNCASFAHLLPASEAHHHRGSGGLFRHSLEVGAWSAQFAEGRIFAFGKTPLERKEEEPRWVVAAFTAGLLHDMGKAASDMAVTSSDGSKEWSPYLMSLWDWGVSIGIKRYFVRWRENRHKRHENTVLLLMNQLMPASLSAWFGRNPEIIQAMMEAVSYQGEHVLTQLVKRGDHTSTDKDQRSTRTPGNELAVGVPVERHILDAARRLLSNGTWTVNKSGSRVWVTREGVFIVWRAAADEIVSLLREDRIPGIPQDMNTIAELLIERDLIEWNKIEKPDNPDKYWDIAPAILQRRNSPSWLKCVKLTHIETLFSSEPPAPAKVLLRGPGDELIEIDGAGDNESMFTLSKPELSQNKEKVADQSPKEKQKKTPPGQDNPASKPGMRMAVPGKKEQAAPPIEKPTPALPPKSESPKPVSAVPIKEGNSEAKQKSEAAEQWLKKQGGDAAALLLNILSDVTGGDKKPEELFGEVGGDLFLRYPDAVRPYGKPSEVSQHLTQASWIVPDPDNPMRKARDMGDGRGLVMTSEVAEQIRSILAPYRHGAAPAPAQAIPKPRQQAAAPRNTAEPVPEDVVKKPVDRQGDKPKASAQRPSNSRDGRPPAPKIEVSKEVADAVDAFMHKANSGQYGSRSAVKGGERWHIVPFGMMTSDFRKQSPIEMRAGLKKIGVSVDDSVVWVKKL